MCPIRIFNRHHTATWHLVPHILHSHKTLNQHHESGSVCLALQHCANTTTTAIMAELNYCKLHRYIPYDQWTVALTHNSHCDPRHSLTCPTLSHQSQASISQYIQSDILQSCNHSKHAASIDKHAAPVDTSFSSPRQ